MMNRYTPVPPIGRSSEMDSDSDAPTTDDVSENDDLDEDFQLNTDNYDDVKSEMKRRMMALSDLETFDNQVSARHHDNGK